MTEGESEHNGFRAIDVCHCQQKDRCGEMRDPTEMRDPIIGRNHSYE